MSVRILISSSLMRAPKGMEVKVQASNLMEALRALVEEYSDELSGRLFEHDGSPRRLLNFYVNGKNVRFLQGFETLLRDGDEVSILPSVSGG
ncbi:MAG: MoaD family protein [Candidatus Bathyarchaeia archaeon]